VFGIEDQGHRERHQFTDLHAEARFADRTEPGLIEAQALVLGANISFNGGLDHTSCDPSGAAWARKEPFRGLWRLQVPQHLGLVNRVPVISSDWAAGHRLGLSLTKSSLIFRQHAGATATASLLKPFEHLDWSLPPTGHCLEAPFNGFMSTRPHRRTFEHQVFS